MRFSKTRSTRATWLGCGALALGLLACAGEEKVPAQQASDISPTASAEPMASQRVGDGDTTIRLSPEIMQDCRFPADPSEVPGFDVNESTLKPRGRDILADVANCMKDGPLQNRTVTIIGRTDARGTEKHNEKLGANRAVATRNYLTQKGVSEKKLLVISRGEDSASGNDAESMALDRRVDLVLGDATERTNISQTPSAIPSKTTGNGAASSYADQGEGGPASGKATGSSGPGTSSK
jgi:outer membrane protein OmpA-like peptidoglycan-associated protein